MRHGLARSRAFTRTHIHCLLHADLEPCAGIQAQKKVLHACKHVHVHRVPVAESNLQRLVVQERDVVRPALGDMMWFAWTCEAVAGVLV